jgi:hypothetical protein
MENYFELFDEKFSKKKTVDENAEKILQDLCEQITERWGKHKIVALLFSTSGDFNSFITYAVHLSVPESNRYYSYRYIEVEQPIDKYFPIQISAFQNPPTLQKKIVGPVELKNELKNILGDIRTRIVEEHLKQVALFDNNLEE